MVAGRILGVGGLRVGSFMPQESEMVGLCRGCYWKLETFMPRCLRVGASRKRYQDMSNYHLLQSDQQGKQNHNQMRHYCLITNHPHLSLPSPFFLSHIILMNKQLIGTASSATSSEITLQIPVAQSFLPVTPCKGGHHDLPKELVYSRDARNPHFSLRITHAAGESELRLSKETMGVFFEKLERIQDELNTYM